MANGLFIIEHPTKGVLTAVPHDIDEKYHWSWARLRSDETTRLFSLGQARKHLRNLPAEAYILEAGTWERVGLDAPGD